MHEATHIRIINIFQIFQRRYILITTWPSFDLTTQHCKETVFDIL
jgi:hypothetical protein